MTNMPRYKIYYKRYDTLGTYIIDCETIDDIVKHSEKLALNSNCYDITIEASVKLKLCDYNFEDIEPQIKEFAKLITTN